MNKKLVRILLIVVSILALMVILGAVSFLMANRATGRLQSGGETRRYLLYVPETYDPSTPAPLVMSIHGFASWPAQQAGISGWNALADEHGFLVVYPFGTDFPMHWRASGDGSDLEVNFISDLIDHLSNQYNIDPQRIYANGLSNGGGMSFLLSCRMADRIAAIGSVSGAYLLPWEECSPARPVPAILYHGTDDQIVPFQGGPSRMFDVPFPEIPGWVAELAARNRCAAEPEQLATIGSVTGLRYHSCEQNAEVMFYTIRGGGHTWPGGEELPRFITGPTNTDIDATRLIWDFFTRHPLEN